jgi:hypothetical protein
MSKKPVVEKKWQGEVFGTQASTSSVIIVFRNGDKHHQGVKITLNPKVIRTIDQLKEKCSSEANLSTGPVRKILTLDGKSVASLEEFENGESYIAVGGEGKIDFTNLPMVLNINAPQRAVSPSSPKSNVDVSSPVKKPVVEKKFQGEKFGTQADKAYFIKIFRNGDKHHTGDKLTVHPKKIKTFDQLLQACNVIQLPTGSVRKLFTPSGKAIKSLEEIEDNGNYICAAGEQLNKEKMPTVLL